MENKVYCSRCCYFYLQNKKSLESFQMKTECTIENLTDLYYTGGYEHEYYINETDNICRKGFEFEVVSKDTYRSNSSVIRINNFAYCKDKNRTNQCKDYEEINYNISAYFMNNEDSEWIR